MWGEGEGEGAFASAKNFHQGGLPPHPIPLPRSTGGEGTGRHVPNDTATPTTAPIESLAGVGPTRGRHFHGLGVRTLGDLVQYFPRSYQYESAERPIAQLVAEQIQTARGEVVAVDYVPTRPRPRFE